RLLRCKGLGLLALLQFVQQIPASLVALGWILGQRLHNEVAEQWMDFWIYMNRRYGRALDDALPQRLDVIAVKSFAFGDHFVKHGREAEQIGAPVHGLPLYLLRRHVMENRRQALCRVMSKVPDARHAIAENLHRAVPAAHDLGRLQAV